MKTNNRLLAYVLIVVGLLILIGKWLSFGTFVALVMLYLGVRKVRAAELRVGYILLGVGGALLLLEHLMLFLGIILISLGIFYSRTRQDEKQERVEKRQNLSASLKWDREPYILHSQSMWHVIGECDIDLSLAILEEPETKLLFQGVMGDMDITIPDDVGVEIEATVLCGQIDVGRDKETGLFNKWTWRSPNYDWADQRVKLYISYIVGDIDIKLHV
ncbi:cell wall-active antibiotics response protein LiaF [Paenibacillus profundus]|uniref:Cell wall-active antibiotics response protein LiaF n=1 Tax=Paenibacillus profundus TaxID=1173085 RepID=A0ABS8YK56_9BACL|nr:MULTISPECIES: cell wall-active antibiotics response protein LiaF [Paenibacillus]MCE5171584.1 cell wall-active antibiotics response protein LiaF [Paenibacillus profundus]MCM3338854.1 cell wall-active antibiotics response protein LiaF [Paenibacillus sp. MER TA 81-3]